MAISNQITLADRSTRGNQTYSLRLFSAHGSVEAKIIKKITCCVFVDNLKKQCLTSRCKVHLLYLQFIRLTYFGCLPLLLVTSRVLSTCDGQKCSLCLRTRACARGYFARQHLPFETKQRNFQSLCHSSEGKRTRVLFFFFIFFSALLV